MARLRKFLTWFRDAAAPPKRKNRRPPARHHATMQAASPSTGRWTHRSIAKRYDVPEDVVRRIYAAMQIAKRQELHGGYMADFIERHVGRKLVGNEYTVATRARDHLNYNPPGGYGGPRPKASAKEPLRVMYDDPKVVRASRLAGSAEAVIKDVLRRRKGAHGGWDETNDQSDRNLLHNAAADLDVAADLYEEAGVRVKAGTLHERAKHARRGNYRLLAAYE